MKLISTFVMTSALFVSASEAAESGPRQVSPTASVLKQVSPAASALKPQRKLVAPLIPTAPPASGSASATPPPSAGVPRDPASPTPKPLPPGPMAEQAVVSDPGPQSPLSASADPAGNVYITSAEVDRGLKLRKLDSAGSLLWSVPVPNRWGNATAIAGNDGVLVVSPENVQRFSGAGVEQFSTRLGQSTGGSTAAVYDGAGGVFLAFFPYPVQGRILKRINRSGAVVFSSAAIPAGSSGNEVEIAADAAGNAFVATGGSQITVRKFSATGAQLWESPITTVFGEKMNVEIVSDGSGGAFVGWSDARRRPGARDIFVQGVSAGGAVRWLAEGLEIVRDPSALGRMNLAADGTGGVYVGYSAGRRLAEVQRVMSVGAKGWPTPAALGAGEPPELATDGSGVFAAARKATDGGPCLSVARLSADGGPMWPESPKTVGTCIHTIPFFPLVVRSQPFLVYTDTRSGYADVYLWR